jgi:hypothetical protein
MVNYRALRLLFALSILFIGSSFGDDAKDKHETPFVLGDAPTASLAELFPTVAVSSLNANDSTAELLVFRDQPANEELQVRCLFSSFEGAISCLHLGLNGEVICLFAQSEYWACTPTTFQLTEVPAWSVNVDDKAVWHWRIMSDSANGLKGPSYFVNGPSFVDKRLRDGLKTTSVISQKEAFGISWQQTAGELFVRRRSEVDESNYGSPLSEIFVRQKHGGRYSLRSLNFNRLSETAIPLANLSQLRSRIKYVASKDPEALAVNSQMSVHGFDFWQVLFPHSSEYSLIATNEKEIDFVTEVVQNIRTLADGKIERELFQKTSNELVKILRLASANGHWFDLLIEQRCIDDPCLVSRRIEKRLGLFLFYELVGRPLVLLIDPVTEATNVTDRLRLAAAIAELGSPPLVGLVDRGLTMQNSDPLLRSVLYSRWQLPCEPGDMELCQKTLADPETSPALQEVLVETFLRWGRLDLLVPERVDAWFDAKVLNASTKVSRWAELSKLSQFRQGATYLLAKRETLTGSNDRKAKASLEAIGKVLQIRAKASRQLERYDTLTKEQCELILANHQK